MASFPQQDMCKNTVLRLQLSGQFILGRAHMKLAESRKNITAIIELRWENVCITLLQLSGLAVHCQSDQNVYKWKVQQVKTI